MLTRRSNIVTMGLWGALSGTIVWILLHLADWTHIPNLSFSFLGGEFAIASGTVIPGFVFGAIFAVLFRSLLRGLGQVGFFFASGIAYFIAYHAASNSVGWWQTGSEGLDLAACGVLAGVVGSILLTIATLRLIAPPGRDGRLLPVIAGGLAGALLALTAHDHSDLAWSFLVLFAGWQGIYAASLAPLLRPQA